MFIALYSVTENDRRDWVYLDLENIEIKPYYSNEEKPLCIFLCIFINKAVFSPKEGDEVSFNGHLYAWAP